MASGMTGATNRIALWRGLALVLAAFAVGLKLITPPGMMLAADPLAGLNLTLCTESGLIAQPAHDSGEQGADHYTCPFALAATIAPPPDPLLLARTETPQYAAPSPAHGVDQRPGRGLAAPPPPSRGPPILS